MGRGKQSLRSDQQERFLACLGLEPELPSLPALNRLIQAFLCRVPFENISKLLRLKEVGPTLPTVDEYLDGIERHHFGGTCYTNNPNLCLLLLSLGYEARLCGADMTNPDAHVCVMVTLEGHDYLLDAGYAAPFAFPIQLDTRKAMVIPAGGDEYVLWPRDSEGRSRLDHMRDGVRIHGYLAKPEPKQLDIFTPAIQRSFMPDAEFRNSLLMTRTCGGRSVKLTGDRLVLFEGAQFEVTEFKNREEVSEAIETHFGITPDIARQALACLPPRG